VEVRGQQARQLEMGRGRRRELKQPTLCSSWLLRYERLLVPVVHASLVTQEEEGTAPHPCC
jgi:hypothetical protein